MGDADKSETSTDKTFCNTLWMMNTVPRSRGRTGHRKNTEELQDWSHPVTASVRNRRSLLSGPCCTTVSNMTVGSTKLDEMKASSSTTPRLQKSDVKGGNIRAHWRKHGFDSWFLARAQRRKANSVIHAIANEADGVCSWTMTPEIIKHARCIQSIGYEI